MDMCNTRFELVSSLETPHGRAVGRRRPGPPVDHPEWLGVQIRDIGSGNFGVAKLMRDRKSGELVAVKFIERGEKVRQGARARWRQLLGGPCDTLWGACRRCRVPASVHWQEEFGRHWQGVQALLSRVACEGAEHCALLPPPAAAAGTRACR